MRFGHLTFSTSLWDTITWNSYYGDGFGGSINVIQGYQIGVVYNGDDGASGDLCSSGAHSHVEGISSHRMGAIYDWRGQGPDYYSDYHVHGGGGFYSVISTDSIGASATIGFLGGNADTYPYIWDNPNYGTH